MATGKQHNRSKPLCSTQIRTHTTPQHMFIIFKSFVVKTGRAERKREREKEICINTQKRHMNREAIRPKRHKINIKKVPTATIQRRVQKKKYKPMTTMTTTHHN